MEKPKNNWRKPQRIGICFECVVRYRDYRKKKLYRCHHCGKWFCEKHIEPRIAKTRGAIEQIKDPVLKDKILDEWRRPDGHPDVIWTRKYFEDLRKKQEEEREKFWEVMNDLKKIKSTEIDSKSKKMPSFYHPQYHYRSFQKNQRRRIPPYENMRTQKSSKPEIIIELSIGRYVWFIVIFFIVLMFLNVLIFRNIKEIDMISVFLRAFLFASFFYGLTIIDKLTGYKIAWRKIFILLIFLIFIWIWYTRDFASLKIINKIVGIPNFFENATLLYNRAKLINFDWDTDILCELTLDDKNDECLKKYETNPIYQRFEYVLRGKKNYITFIVYGGVNDYFERLSRPYNDLGFLSNRIQEKYIKDFVELIKSKAPLSDDQARIAISIVQKIPYDWYAFRNDKIKNRYPYQVLYEKKGVCSEKSRLLALILKELGYGVVLFHFEPEKHMAVGIKCPIIYSYRGTGYCFIETSRTTIITNHEEEYIGVGNLYSMPEIIKISDGKSFDSVFEEYLDAKEWQRINEISKLSGNVLDFYNYNKWLSLVNKYGIEIE